MYNRFQRIYVVCAAECAAECGIGLASSGCNQEVARDLMGRVESLEIQFTFSRDGQEID